MAGRKIDFSITPFQLIFLIASSLTAVIGAFTLGIMVGKEGMEGIPLLNSNVKSEVVKMKIDPPPMNLPDTKTDVNEGKKSAVQENVTSKPVITFYDTLTRKEQKPVRSEPVRKEKSGNGAAYTIQVGAMKDRSLADAMASKLRKFGYSVYLSPLDSPGKDTLYRVRIGTFKSKEDAREEAARIKKNEKLPATVVEK